MGLRVNAALRLANPQPERATARGLVQTSSRVPAGLPQPTYARPLAVGDRQISAATDSDELLMDE